MTIDETIKRCEAVAEDYERHLKVYENMDEDRPLFKEEENECRECANEHRQLAEWLKKLRAYRKAKEKIEKMDTNYYKHCNGLDMTACAEDFKFEVLRIINECVESELINDEDSD